MPAIRIGAREQRALRRESREISLIGSGTGTTSSTTGSSPSGSSRLSRDAPSPLTSLSPSPEPKGKKQSTIVIRGQQLEPTVVFDTLWRWLFERKSIDDRRRAGMPPPWTFNQILLKYKFCNAYRVLDRTSQFVVAAVIEKGSQNRTELLFRILLFNCFNRIETWQLLEEAFGSTPTWKDFDLARYNEVLSAAVHRGVSLFSSAYIKIGYKLDYHANHMRHLQLLEILMDALPDVLARPSSAAEVYEQIAAYPGMAAFTTYQLMISLSYSKLLNFSANDFVVAGPGASSGLVKMFGSSMKRAKEKVPDIESDVLRWMATTQREHFARLGIEFPFLRNAKGQELELDLADIEHAVCETDKYARKVHPGVRGLGDRTQLRGTFHASPDVLPAVPVLPKAWADPARRVVRVRPGPLVVENKWVLVKILNERPAENRNHADTTEYQVSWFGYDKPTWEPRYAISQDAPELVKEYEAAKAKAKKARR
ncbi:hypothetical protein DFH06DRAFT_1482679 [Mycena polygramma]|nr:hypothetical protein DFH06DRAFT_1482679 [Mycena polygramma]